MQSCTIICRFSECLKWICGLSESPKRLPCKGSTAGRTDSGIEQALESNAARTCSRQKGRGAEAKQGVQRDLLVSDVLIVHILSHNTREGMAAPQVLHEGVLKLLRVTLNHCTVHSLLR